MRKPIIEDRARGPELESSRITVYDVMDYYLDGWPAGRIANWLMQRTDEVQAAIDYIEAHRAEVDEDYRKILLERCERGNPPEVVALIQAGRPALEAKKAEILKLARERKEAEQKGLGLEREPAVKGILATSTSPASAELVATFYASAEWSEFGTTSGWPACSLPTSGLPHGTGRLGLANLQGQRAGPDYGIRNKDAHVAGSDPPRTAQTGKPSRRHGVEAEITGLGRRLHRPSGGQAARLPTEHRQLPGAGRLYVP